MDFLTQKSDISSLSVEMHRVLKNTYMLLSMTLIFSAIVAVISMSVGAPDPGLLVFFVGVLGFSYLVNKTANSGYGILSVFAFTGFFGYTLGPILSRVLSSGSGGYEVVAMALGGTGAIFLASSAFVMVTRKNLSFMGNMLFSGLIVLLLAILASFLFDMSGLSLAISAFCILLMSGYIAYETSMIIHGGQTNYILATTSLFVSIFNIFVSLLNLLNALGNDD